MGRASRKKRERGKADPLAVIEEHEQMGWTFADYAVSGDELRILMHNHATGEGKTLLFGSGGGMRWGDILPSRGPWHTGQPY